MVLIKFITALLLTYMLGKVMRHFKFPALIGWLLGGLFCGPEFLNLVSPALLKTPTIHFISALSETAVGIIIGINIRTHRTKTIQPRVLRDTLLRSFMTYIVISLLFIPIFMILKLPLYTAFIIGSIALASSPENTIPSLEAYQKSGPQHTSLISVAMINDLFAVFLFFMTLSLTTTLTSGQGVSFMSLLDALVLPLVIGSLVGALAGKLSAYINPKVAGYVAILGAGSVMFFANHTIDAIPIASQFITGLVASAFFINIAPPSVRDSTEYALKPLALFGLFYTVFIMGIPLQWTLVLAYFTYTLVYLVSTSIHKRVGDVISRKFGEKKRTMVKYISLTFLPHTGISLFLTGIAVSKISALDPKSALVIQGTLTLATLISELLADARENYLAKHAS